MPASPHQIARYGHIAALLREAMEQSGLSANMVAKAIKVTPSAVYGWCAAKNAPNDLYRPALAKLLSLPEAALMTRAEGPLSSKAAKSEIIPHTPTKSGPDPLSFTITSSGDCRIRLDITLPLEQGTPLLRMLLDANLLRSIPDA